MCLVKTKKIEEEKGEKRKDGKQIKKQDGNIS